MPEGTGRLAIIRIDHHVRVGLGHVDRVAARRGRAVSLHSGSLQCLFGERLTLPNPEGQPIDLGHVGQVTRVERDLISDFCAASVVPVIPSLAIGPDGGWLNVNADTAAAAVAVALGAEKLLLLTDVDGLYRDWPTSAEVISELDAAELRELLPGLRSGMIPKMEACLRAVEGGVSRAHVLDGRVAHALLVEVFTDEGIGTMVYSHDRPRSARPAMRAPSRTARND
jgi:acetylglutamate kinase